MIALGQEDATSWRRRAAWLLAAVLVATAFSVAQPGPETSAAAECVPVEVSEFGSEPLALSDPGPHCFLFTTGAAQPYLVKAGFGAQASLYHPDGRLLWPEDHWQVNQFDLYLLAAGTTYRVEITQDQDSFAVYDPVQGEGCGALNGTSWASPPQQLLILDDKLHCRTFNLAEGAVVRVAKGWDSELAVLNGNGDFLCGTSAHFGGDSFPCRLEGPSPYRLLVANDRQAPSNPIDVSVVDTASTAGCIDVTTTAWSTSLPQFPRWASGKWQCFQVDPEVTGDHLLRFLAPQKWATYELWQVGEGEVLGNTTDDTATGYLVENLEAGESYRYILKGNARPEEPGYRFGLLDLSNDDGCSPGVNLQWTAPSTEGQFPVGGMDCYAVSASVGDRYRVQATTSILGESVSTRITDANGASACAPSGGGGCLFQGPAPYRLLVGQALSRHEAQSLPYALNLTDVSLPGCGTTELATWNAPLPLVAEDPDDGSAYSCYRLRTTAATSYAFSGWVESGAGSRAYELWKTGDPQTGPGAGLVVPERRMTLLPNTEYRLVISGRGPDESAGEFRAGVFDVNGGQGCIRVTDVSWSAPPITGDVQKGELDCHEVFAEAGDRVRMEWEIQTELFSVDGSDCSRHVCGSAQATRVRAITGPGGSGPTPYAFWLNELTDTTGCEARPFATEPFAPPMVAELSHHETRCFVVDPPGDEVQFWSDLELGPQTPYLISPEGDDFYSCDLHISGFCGRLDGPQTLVMRNLSTTPGRAAVLLRDNTGYPEACQPLTAAGFRGELEGIYDEECFSFALPEGTVYNMQAVGVTGSAQPDAVVFGDGASCENFFCVAPGGTQTMRIINEGEGSGTYRVDLSFFHATFNLGPYLTGKPKVGSKLRVVHGGTSPAGAKVAVRWLRDGKAFKSGLRYRVRNRDRGHVIRPRVTVSSPGYLSTVITLKGVRIKRR